jgi:hypothetical protein
MSQLCILITIDLRSKIEAEIFSILVENGTKEMNLSEYAPKMVYQEDTKNGLPVTTVLKKVFESFDDDQKGYISADDLARVVKKLTGEELSENDKKEMMAATVDESSATGLSLSGFSKLFAGLKHKHYPRGHVVFNAGDEGDASKLSFSCVRACSIDACLNQSGFSVFYK